MIRVTKTRGFLHLDQIVLNATQNSLCRAVNPMVRSLHVQSQQLLMESQVFTAWHPSA